MGLYLKGLVFVIKGNSPLVSDQFEIYGKTDVTKCCILVRFNQLRHALRGISL